VTGEPSEQSPAWGDKTEDEPDVDSWHIPVPLADRLICLALVLATLAAYARVVRFGFIILDDGQYVYGNTHLRGGWTLQTLKWVFLSFDPDHWFPVTRFSLFLDYNLFRLRPGLYHAENVLIHCLAALLLFGFLRRATRVRWPCAFVALMFALHPLHVESVAWISERKDVLSAFLWFATLWAWLRYTEHPVPKRYAAALSLFILGLMSKSMIVTLPFLLFLLDIWPLRRAFSRKLIAEKIPFIALSCAVAAITVIAQQRAHGIRMLSALPLPLRAENALITIAIYIADTLWPARLWIARAYPRNLPAWQAIAAAAAIAAVSAFVWLQRRKNPYLAVGWLWFLGTLAPVIGLLQAGPQARSDRYMYVPMVGLSIMFAWGVAGAVARWPRLRTWASVLGVAACLAMALKTSFQTTSWRESETLFRHAVEMDNQDDLAWNYLGGAIMEAHPERAFEAVSCYRAALRIRPETADTHSNLAGALCRSDQLEEGIAEYREAIRLNRASGQTHFQFAAALDKMDRRNEAVEEFQKALRFEPRFALAHSDLGVLLWKTPGRSAEGLLHLEKAVEIEPDNAPAQSNLGLALLSIPDRAAEAIPHLEEALRINPGLVGAHLGLAAAFTQVPGMESAEEAMAHLQAAQRLQRKGEPGQ
jgi:tetratricopeptide (TPR) repeat protein